MILPTMVYALCVAGLLGLFAWVTEHVCAELGRARRWAWVFAMTASLARKTSGRSQRSISGSSEWRRRARVHSLFAACSSIASEGTKPH